MREVAGFCACLLLVTVTACDGGDSAQDSQPPASPALNAPESNDQLDGLLAADATVERIAEGFQFIEGPVWVGGTDDGHLLFSDIPGDTVFRWSESEGTSVFLSPVFLPELETNGVGGSNGLTLDLEGRLVLCEHGNRRVARIEDDGNRVTLADRYDGKRLNSPNDIVYHSSGAAFFTDPPYGLANPEAGELGFQGIYRLDPDGSVTLLSDVMSRPNGIGLSPDEATLYVANSDVERVWMAFPLTDDLNVGEGRVLLDLSASEDPGAPDGFAVDTLGNIWASGPGGVVVISPDGDHLGTIRTPELPANAAFGNDGHMLYMTSRTGLYRIDTLVQGLMPGPAAAVDST